MHQHSGDEINFTPKTRINVCEQENVKLTLSDFNESSPCIYNVQNGKPDRSSESYFTNSVVETKFP